MAKEKFRLIESTIKKYKLKNVISYLCKLVGVSRSRYYNYFSLKSQETRECFDNRDEVAEDNILKAFHFKRRKKGARQIKMTLESQYGIVYNLKRIRRIMKKYEIICPIRKANPYRRMMKATKVHTVKSNLLNRNFKQNIPGKVLLTDITYLFYKNRKKAYLSTIKDTFIQSDQGVHYTSPKFQTLLKQCSLGQSMSRRGNCWDNAPQESFFGHFKDESYIKECNNIAELKTEIDAYRDYYNNYRCQWNLNKMIPIQ